MGFSIILMRKMERRLIRSVTSINSATKINLIRWRRGWQWWSCVTRGTPPISGTMLLLITKGFYYTLFLTWMDYRILWMVMTPSTLREVCRPLYHIIKYQITSSLALVQWLFFCKEKVMALIILIIWITSITWWWWWHTPTHLYHWWKGKHCAGWTLTLISPSDLSIGLNW